MKSLTALFIALLLVGASCTLKPENNVSSVLKHYNDINETLPKYRMVRVDDITARQNGNITGYYRENEVKKIMAEHYSDTSRTFSEYYFDDGMLIYIVEQNFVYNKPQSYTEEKARSVGDSVWYDDKKTRMEVNRYFFNQNKMFRWVRPDGTDAPTKQADFRNKEVILWAETLVLLKELKDQ